MKMLTLAGNGLASAAPLVALLIPSDEALPAEIAALIEAEDFAGKARQSALVYPRGSLPMRRVLLIGLGPAQDVTAEAVRRASAAAAKKALELTVDEFAIALPSLPKVAPVVAGQAACEGALLGAYRFTEFKSGEQPAAPSQCTLYALDEAALAQGVAIGTAIAHGTHLARDLANGPGNSVTPTRLGEVALALAEEYGFAATVLNRAELIAQGFGGIVAVGKGSAEEPRFIVLEHGSAAEGRPTICLVGKGITFDTGGISIKPAESMDNMKMDMGGAAAVFGAMRALGELNLPLHVVGIICAAENMPSSTAYKPGDIVRTLSGKTVEVLNTDAEGRIVLADGLFYAQRYNPAAIVDLATLTGAIMVALGPHAIGAMGNNREVMERVLAAGQASGELAWELPLFDEYREMMKSEIADLKNTGGRFGGAITAAGFLDAFVGGMPWVHLDIAGTAWVESATRPYYQKGATGVGVRLLIQFLQGYLAA